MRYRLHARPWQRATLRVAASRDPLRIGILTVLTSRDSSELSPGSIMHGAEPCETNRYHRISRGLLASLGKVKPVHLRTAKIPITMGISPFSPFPTRADSRPASASPRARARVQPMKRLITFRRNTLGRKYPARGFDSIPTCRGRGDQPSRNITAIGVPRTPAPREIAVLARLLTGAFSCAYDFSRRIRGVTQRKRFL